MDFIIILTSLMCKLRVMRVALFEVKMVVRGRARISMQVFWFQAQCPFLGFYAAVSTISIYNTLSLAFYQCTSTSTLHPFQEFSWNLPHLGVFVMFPQHFVYSWNQIDHKGEVGSSKMLWHLLLWLSAEMQCIPTNQWLLGPDIFKGRCLQQDPNSSDFYLSLG